MESIYRCFVVVLCVAKINCANVLFIPMHLTDSHKKSMAPVAELLGQRGHFVGIWSPLLNDKPFESKYFREIAFDVGLKDGTLPDIFQDESASARLLWSLSSNKPWDEPGFWLLNVPLCKAAIKKEEIDKIITLKKWDLIVTDAWCTPCAYLVANLTGAPIVSWSTTMNAPTTVWARMVPEPFATYPGLSIRETTDLRFFNSRLYNTIMQLIFSGVNKINEVIVRDSLVPYWFDGFTNFERNATQAVSQLPQQLEWVRPQMHEIVATLPTCASPRPLKRELEEFVSDPKSKGTIVIAFGHSIKWQAAPPVVVTAFEAAMGQLSNYRIVWQRDDRESRKLASHIHQMTWIPQIDLLNHAKTVAFISHVGLKSFVESVCAGVPLVAMPQFGDQYRHGAFILARKIGAFIDKFQLTADVIVDAVREVVSDPTYRRNMMHQQEIIHDQIISAVDFEAFLVERAIRQTYKLRLLRNRGSFLNVVQFFSIDILAAVMAIAVVSGIASFKLGRRLFFIVYKSKHDD